MRLKPQLLGELTQSRAPAADARRFHEVRTSARAAPHGSATEPARLEDKMAQPPINAFERTVHDEPPCPLQGCRIQSNNEGGSSIPPKSSKQSKLSPKPMHAGKLLPRVPRRENLTSNLTTLTCSCRNQIEIEIEYIEKQEEHTTFRPIILPKPPTELRASRTHPPGLCRTAHEKERPKPPDGVRCRGAMIKSAKDPKIDLKAPS